MFLRTDFVGEKTLFQRLRLHSTEWNRNMAIISSFTCCTESDKPIQVVRAIKNIQRCLSYLIHSLTLFKALDDSQSCTSLCAFKHSARGTCTSRLRKKGQAEVTPRPRWHLMGVTLGLAELRLHCLQSTYHMEGRAACQKIQTPGQAKDNCYKSHTESGDRDVSKTRLWLDSSTHRTAR